MERRGLVAGIVLCALGIFFLLRRYWDLSGPGPILVLIGAILLATSFGRARGPVFPGAVLLGLGVGLLARLALSPWLPAWGTILLGLSGGLFLASALDRTRRREGAAPLLAAIVLLAIVLGSAVARRWDLSQPARVLAAVWPWALIAAGVLIVVTALRRR